MAGPSWIGALWVTLLAQTVASFLVQSLPAVAPLMTAEGGLRPEAIGNLASITALGTVLFLLVGGGVLARFGPVRTLQAGALLLALATLIGADGGVWALGLAALLIGIGYAPAAPAGSQILAETAPRDHRTLIFSIKQAGAPLGGTFAGLLCAPVAAWLGWRAALLLGGLLALFVTGAAGAGVPATTLMAAATGALAASWNGIVMSEVAALVPRERVGEATAGCTLVIFLGYLVGPTVFAWVVGAGGSWTLAFLGIAAQLLVVATVVAPALPRQGRYDRACRGSPSA